VVLEMLVTRLATTTGDEPETLAIYGLGAVAKCADEVGARAVRALVDLLAHRAPFFRFEAAAVLGDVAGPDVLPALRAIVDDPALPRAKSRSTAWSVGENARRAIAKIEAAMAER
jgi:HEAT repeat protein